MIRLYLEASALLVAGLLAFVLFGGLSRFYSGLFAAFGHTTP